jgi:uncharacterized membrane protein YcjF (UPF0283 family)
MQNAFVKAEEFADHVKEYINNRIAAVKLQTAEKTSKFASNFIAIAVVAAIMLVFAIFISMGIAYLFCEWIGNSWSGFMIVGGMWLMIAFTLWISREKWLRMPMMNKMLQEMFKDEEDT